MYSVQRTTESHSVVSIPVVDFKDVRSSTGHVERRPVVRTTASIGDSNFDIELTLADRKEMRFPMLLGRTAIAGRFVVDPSKAYAFGRRS